MYSHVLPHQNFIKSLYFKTHIALSTILFNIFQGLLQENELCR